MVFLRQYENISKYINMMGGDFLKYSWSKLRVNCPILVDEYKSIYRALLVIKSHVPMNRHLSNKTYNED